MLLWNLWRSSTISNFLLGILHISKPYVFFFRIKYKARIVKTMRIKSKTEQKRMKFPRKKRWNIKMEIKQDETCWLSYYVHSWKKRWIPLIHKHCRNRVTLNEKNLSKNAASFINWSYFRVPNKRMPYVYWFSVFFPPVRSYLDSYVY